MNGAHLSGDHIVKSVSRMESISLADLLRDDSAEESECSEFFHRADDNDKVLHGPYTVEDYRGWVSDGHFTGEQTIMKTIRSRMKSFSLSDVLRADDGGAYYTKQEFFDHYNDLVRWNSGYNSN